MANSQWQCYKCGQKVELNNPPVAVPCPSGGNHVWDRVRRFVSVITGVFRK